MSTMPTTANLSRYDQICKLINEEIDEAVAEDYASSGFDNKEQYRDSLIANYCNFLKKDLQSDNA